jgi:hypothetical protein
MPPVVANEIEDLRREVGELEGLILDCVLDEPQHKRADHNPATEKVAQHNRISDEPEHEQAYRTNQVDTPNDAAAFSNGSLSVLLQFRR